MLEVIKNGDEVVGLRLEGQEFLVEDETGEVMIPKAQLKAFRLSEIPEELVVKPVEAIEGNVIHRDFDISIGSFRERSASAEVEDMGRRKLWDGEVGFSKFMDAMREAIRQRTETLGDVKEGHFEDDGDYVFVRYEVGLAEDMEIEKAMAHVEGVIRQLEKRRDQILARRLDPLLNIYDKGSFEIDLAHALGVAQATGRDAALILVDIDHFKRINDSLGHPMGDSVLVGVARILAERIGERGEAYRWGGEELAVLLPRCDASAAVAIAQDIRHSVETKEFDQGVRVTVSCGVATYATNTRTPHDLVASADAALYAAKSAGRNVVRVAGTG